VLTNIWPYKEDWITPSVGAREEVDRFRKELGTDTLDVCAIHCMLNERWPEEMARVRDELSKLKEEGAVRAVGSTGRASSTGPGTARLRRATLSARASSTR
jgi:aryl-alcohol dehydrogenase-like predicted oxidoreductase